MFDGVKSRSLAPVTDFKIKTCYYNEYLHTRSSAGMKLPGFEGIKVHQYPYGSGSPSNLFDYMFYDGDESSAINKALCIKAVFEG